MKTFIIFFGLIAAILPGIHGLYGLTRQEHVVREMKKAGIIPDVVSKGTMDMVALYFGEGENAVRAHFGVKVPANLTKEKPTLIDYAGRYNEYHTVIITTPDVPNRQNHKYREVIHYLHINIPANNLKKGDVLIDWLKLEPPQQGQRRFVCLVYKQERKQYFFNFDKIPSDVLDKRRNFSTQKFIERFHMNSFYEGRSEAAAFFEVA